GTVRGRWHGAPRLLTGGRGLPTRDPPASQAPHPAPAARRRAQAATPQESAMPDNPRVQQLLDELLDKQATPEEVCGSCVELLPVVRDRWQQICRARAELAALFPVGPGGTHSPLPPEDRPLPTVPGYEVEAVLGRGGVGVVYKARHLRLNRLVALKMLLAGDYAGPADRARFQREAEAVAALRHPNVVQVYDVGDAD